jgi:hypothetical protein
MKMMLMILNLLDNPYILFTLVCLAIMELNIYSTGYWRALQVWNEGIRQRRQEYDDIKNSKNVSLLREYQYDELPFPFTQSGLFFKLLYRYGVVFPIAFVTKVSTMAGLWVITQHSSFLVASIWTISVLSMLCLFWRPPSFMKEMLSAYSKKRKVFETMQILLWGPGIIMAAVVSVFLPVIAKKSFWIIRTVSAWMIKRIGKTLAGVCHRVLYKMERSMERVRQERYRICRGIFKWLTGLDVDRSSQNRFKWSA